MILGESGIDERLAEFGLGPLPVRDPSAGGVGYRARDVFERRSVWPGELEVRADWPFVGEDGDGSAGDVPRRH